MQVVIIIRHLILIRGMLLPVEVIDLLYYAKGLDSA